MAGPYRPDGRGMPPLGKIVPPRSPAALVRLPPWGAHADATGRVSATAPPEHRALLAKVLKIVGIHDLGARPGADAITHTEWVELQRLAGEAPRG